MSDELNPSAPAAGVVKQKSGMARTLLIMLAAVAVLVAVGLGAYVYMNPPAPATGGPPPSAAAQDFFAERGNGTPGVFTNTVGSGGGPGLTGRLPGVTGIVEQVSGNDITVKNPMDGITTTIQAGPQTVVRKQADVKLDAITPGTTLNAIGQKTGDVLAADLIQVGGAAGAADAPPVGGPMQLQIQPGPGGTTGRNPQAAPTQVTGTVDKIDGTTITLKTADGLVTVQVSASTQLHQQVAADLAAIAPGDMVTAQGTPTGTLFVATSIDISTGGELMIRQP